MTKSKQQKSRAARRLLAQAQLVNSMANAKIALTNQKVSNRTNAVKLKKNKPFSATGQILGSAVGSMFGQSTLGGGIGKWLGKGIGTIFGSGDYQMVGQNPSYNVLTNGAQIPKFSSTRATNIVSHREFLGDVTGTSAFTNRKFPLNPGSEVTFPWLNTIAQNYQQYKFHGLIFEFRPLITDFVTGGAPGVVVMATNYNADEPLYLSKQAMENSEFAVSVKPTCNLMHGIECAASQTPISELYVRNANMASNLDLKFTDLGNFQFATQGNPVQLLGELWVSYTVEFFKPLLPLDVGGDIQSGTADITSATNTNPLLGPSVFTGDLLDFTITPGSDTASWTAQPGNAYMLVIYWQGGSGTMQHPTVTLTGLVSKNTFFTDTSSALLAPANGATASSLMQVRTYTCSLTTPGIVGVKFAAGGQLPTVATASMMVTQISNVV